ncbi:RNA-binding protein [Candidatus Bathyarchaeota archaeon A05DMB-2]|jgi:predicted SPOUT superfamily RNA methylase MTH1|nr:RNA-binding protein [Candidatus Bathyarchaeota archaeon A05DMB-2]
MNNKKVAIAIPASVISDTPHLREKTSKIGLIGRAAAIFQVNEIIVYPDSPKVNQRGDMALIALLLAYMETPQYLRKRLFKLEPQLQFAGILPPLRTPHHPLNRKAADLKVGEFREGVVLSRTHEGALVDIGVEHTAIMRETKTPVGERLTVKIVKVTERVEVETADRAEIPVYWGYRISAEKRSFSELMKEGRYDLTVATSKFGSKFADVADKLSERWAKANSVLLAFGAPSRGLFEIARDEGENLNTLVDFVVNTIPSQGTETIRTEEALFASLALFRTWLKR